MEERKNMKIELFNLAVNSRAKVKKFVETHQIIDIQVSATEMNCMITVLYDDNPLNYKVKYFNESEYQDLSDTYARMQDAVNKFCTNHDVVKIETTQNNDEDLVTVVTYKEQLNDN